MKKIALIMFACALSLTAWCGDWEYSKGKAWLLSTDYLEFDYSKPTTLGVLVAYDDSGKVGVMCILNGEHTDFNFRERQMYVKVEMGLETMKFPVQLHTIQFGGADRRVFIFADADRLVQLFGENEWFAITVPIYGHGTHKFYFSADYPLDW